MAQNLVSHVTNVQRVDDVLLWEIHLLFWFIAASVSHRVLSKRTVPWDTPKTL